MATVRANIIQSQFRFSVPTKNSDEFETPEIIVGGIPWKIRIRKVSAYEESGDRDIINALLICNYKVSEGEKSKWMIEAGAVLRLLTATQQPIEKTISKKMFEDGNLKTELKNFISWQDLTDEKNGYVKDDHYTFDAMISSSPLRNEVTTSPGFELTNTQFDMFLSNVKCDANNYIAELSPVVTLRGIKWQVKVLKGTDGLNVHLINTRDETNFGWSFDVEFKVKLPSFNDDVESHEKSFKQRFNTDGVELGWKPFINKDDLMNEQLNYVRDGNAILEISVDVGPWQPSARGEQKLLNNGIKLKVSKCLICSEKLIDQEVSSTPCGHLFCTACIIDPIKKNKKCPSCNENATLPQIRVVYLNS